MSEETQGPGEVARRRDGDDFILAIRDTLANQSEVVWNVRQVVVVTTRTKIELALRRVLPRHLSNEVWVAPLSFLVALAASLVSADFTDFMGVPSEAWVAIFIIAAIFSVGWLIKGLLRFRKRATLEEVVQEIVNTSDLSDTTPPAAPDAVG